VIAIRPETSDDIAAVRHINEAAFDTSTEAGLVDALRSNGAATISLVADINGQVVGHILFSPVSIEPESSVANPLGLGPMAVLPEFQNQGIGSQLVREGLEECRRLGCEMVVVVGHPEYYPRFGFVPASRHGLSCEYPVLDDVFMALEVKPGALSDQHGLVKYRKEFNEAG
jgi:putative acetyltransferase